MLRSSRGLGAGGKQRAETQDREMVGKTAAEKKADETSDDMVMERED